MEDPAAAEFREACAPHADFVVLEDAIKDRLDWLKSDEMPRKFYIGDGDFNRLHFGPGQLIVVGGFAGSGKSCLVAEWVFNTVAADSELRAVVTNVDVSLEKFVERQLARISGVDADVLHWKKYGEHEDEIMRRLDDAAAKLQSTARRIAFLSKPVTTAKLRRAAIAFDAHILVADYIQECAVDSKVLDDATLNVKSVMRDLRTLRDAGYTVFAVSSMRQQAGGLSADRLSYRDSSEIGLMADDCYVLETQVDPNEDGIRSAELRCDKARYGQPATLRLRFDGALQSFEAPEHTHA